MMKYTLVIAATALAGVTAPALAGEVTGNGKKEDFAQGRSPCKFSGLNDIPEGDHEEGPAGRTQNYGHGENIWAEPGSLDPHGGFQLHPGWLCNPTNTGAAGR
jgi:hypothetical protein